MYNSKNKSHDFAKRIMGKENEKKDEGMYEP